MGKHRRKKNTRAPNEIAVPAAAAEVVAVAAAAAASDDEVPERERKDSVSAKVLRISHADDASSHSQGGGAARGSDGDVADALRTQDDAESTRSSSTSENEAPEAIEDNAVDGNT